mmetsp:Transcript_44799/g.118321  ORF Transcript_44799/g.118321 Transcript_44799/m.118321 type:complete len:80 (+) Transcript_44799:81-320(+)
MPRTTAWHSGDPHADCLATGKTLGQACAQRNPSPAQGSAAHADYLVQKQKWDGSVGSSSVREERIPCCAAIRCCLASAV